MTSFRAHVDGDPASVIAAGAWLDDSLAPKVDAGSKALGDARRSAQGDWDGVAGEAFSSTMGQARSRSVDLGSAATSAAREITAFGRQLSSFQDRMADIRATASAAGLTVKGDEVMFPSPAPAEPADIPAGTEMPVDEARTHNAAVEAWNAHQVLVTAWTTGERDSIEVQTELDACCTTLSDRYRGQSGPQVVLTAADIAGGVAGGVLTFKASSLRGTGTHFKGLSDTHLDRALRADPAVAGRERWYRDVDDAKKLGRNADDLVRSADDLERTGKTMPLKVGGALAVAGIAYDIHNGKDPVQATVSGGLGFGASVAAGAAIGTLIPVPVVGTAIGAVVGAGVGIFTSGMVDNLFEGGDLGDAAEAGLDAVQDTGGAIVDGIEDVGGAIGGLFD